MGSIHSSLNNKNKIDTTISIIGIGFVGGAMLECFKAKKISVKGYDIFKESDSFEDCAKTDIMFLCLPTLFNESKNEYDKAPIIETCEKLELLKYTGIVVIKSTIEPTTTNSLASQFPTLKFIHNPEFLTAATALHDFENQSHIVLGKCKSSMILDKDVELVHSFYTQVFPNAKISICSSLESESMKVFLNCFYATKIQFFNELYLLCENMDCEYKNVMELMLKNNWINSMHTKVPGTDGKLSYGGFCFPKDTRALLEHMKREKTPCAILEAVVEERGRMRSDNVNIQK